MQTEDKRIGTMATTTREAITVDYHEVSFFFSSRRRHTRFDCDWSSDVCSSDLGLETHLPTDWVIFGVNVSPTKHVVFMGIAAALVFLTIWYGGRQVARRHREGKRSEERRVGEEGRSRGSPYH